MSILNRLVRIFYREPDFYIGGKDAPYLMRWYVIPRNQWFNVYLHKFTRDDDDRALHDHPWTSLSFALWDRYIEHTKDWTKIRRMGSVVWRAATHTHRVELFKQDDMPIPAWTLFLTGPKVREWGFACPKGWVPWQVYCAEAEGGNKVGKGCDD